MNKYLLFFAILHCTASYSQVDKRVAPSKEDLAYLEQREKLSIPPFGRQKVSAGAVDNKAYQAFSLREKFTYNMTRFESFHQICSLHMPTGDDQRKIFSHLPDLFGDLAWSEKQLKFFHSNRDSVIALMKICISKDQFVGLNFKHTIVELNATELIPLLIETYKRKMNDQDVLTVLMLLMDHNKYGPFIKSTSYNQLYGKDVSYYDGSLELNSSNRELIIKPATDFYKGLHQCLLL